ncbi:MAG TPA: hypothetical protein VGG10_14405 [Rhizomicrobium sp.]
MKVIDILKGFPEMSNRRGYRALFGIVAVLAVATFVSAFLTSRAYGFWQAGVNSLWMGAAWCLLAATGIALYRKSGLWLLISSPVALFFPIYFLFFWDGGCGGTGCL